MCSPSPAPAPSGGGLNRDPDRARAPRLSFYLSRFLTLRDGPLFLGDRLPDLGLGCAEGGRDLLPLPRSASAAASATATPAMGIVSASSVPSPLALTSGEGLCRCCGWALPPPRRWSAGRESDGVASIIRWPAGSAKKGCRGPLPPLLPLASPLLPALWARCHRCWASAVWRTGGHLLTNAGMPQRRMRAPLARGARNGGGRGGPHTHVGPPRRTATKRKGRRRKSSADFQLDSPEVRTPLPHGSLRLRPAAEAGLQETCVQVVCRRSLRARYQRPSVGPLTRRQEESRKLNGRLYYLIS